MAAAYSGGIANATTAAISWRHRRRHRRQSGCRSSNIQSIDTLHLTTTLRYVTWWL